MERLSCMMSNMVNLVHFTKFVIMKKLQNILPYYLNHAIVAMVIFGLIDLFTGSPESSFWGAVTPYTLREIDDAFINGKGQERAFEGDTKIDWIGWAAPTALVILLYFGIKLIG